MKTSFILCLIVLGIAITCSLTFFRKRENVKMNIFMAVVSCIIGITILAVPLMEYTNPYTKIFAAFIYATKCIGFGQNLEVLSKITLNSTLGYMYFVLINLLFLLLPSLSLSFVITYLEKIVTSIKLKIIKNKKIIVFSELNDKSLLIAKNMNKGYAIIFANIVGKPEVNIKSIKTSKDVFDIKFVSNSNITFYMINKNEEENLNKSLELINKYKNYNNIKIYVVNRSDEAPTILDSTNKGKITVDIIDETERKIFKLLYDKPLFLNVVNKTISILIVGCGNIGKEFLKDAIWCGMISDYKLRILVVDVNADKIKENLDVESPELLDNYDITFINEDIKSKKAIEEIKKREDINYILVSMDNDDKNIDTAIMLRRLFLRSFDREPIINIYIDDKNKNKEVSNLSNEKGNPYNINAFGSINDLYKKGSDFEKIAIKIHLSYDKTDYDLFRYNLREYNKRSSRAVAIHIKYKLFSVLKDKYRDNLKEDLQLFREMYSDDIEELLAKNEHDRWMAYVRSIGYTLATIENVKKYYKKTNHYINYLAKLHPALVSYDKLDKVSEEISKITSKEINLKENDRMIIKNIYKIIDL